MYVLHHVLSKQGLFIMNYLEVDDWGVMKKYKSSKMTCGVFQFSLCLFVWGLYLQSALS
jgi:hypothetical protein